MNTIAKIISPTSITVVLDGRPRTVRREQPEYDQLKELLSKMEQPTTSDRQRLEILLDRPAAIAQFTEGRVKAFGNGVTFDGHDVHGTLVNRIISAASSGLDPKPLMRFLEKLHDNPSYRAVRGAYEWLERCNFPISGEGNFLAWKIVRDDYKDCHTGTFDNTPGRTVRIPRNQCDENPDQTCSKGLHFCSTEYLPRYGSAGNRVVMVEIDPRNLVAFPKDYNLSKGRCCEYRVVMEIPKDEAGQYFENAGTPVYSVENPAPEKEPSIEDRTRFLISELLDVPGEKLILSQSFEGLGVDSLDHVQLTMAVEEEFDIKVSDEQSDSISTFGDLVRLIQSKVLDVSDVIAKMEDLTGVDLEGDEPIADQLEPDEHELVEFYLDEEFGGYVSPDFCDARISLITPRQLAETALSFLE